MTVSLLILISYTELLTKCSLVGVNSAEIFRILSVLKHTMT